MSGHCSSQESGMCSSVFDVLEHIPVCSRADEETVKWHDHLKFISSVYIQISDMDWGTAARPPQSKKHQLSVWLWHCDANSFCTKRDCGSLYARPDLLLFQAGRPSESWGAQERESEGPTLLGTGRQNTTALPKLNGIFVLFIIFEVICKHQLLKKDGMLCEM